jgi:hypothetical protein
LGFIVAVDFGSAADRLLSRSVSESRELVDDRGLAQKHRATGSSNPYSNGVAASAAVDQALGGAAGTAAGLQKPSANTVSLDITGG